MATPALKSRIERILLAEFSGPLDEVNVYDGYMNNVHVWVASPRFRGTPDYARQDQVWDVLKAALSDDELVLVSLLMAFDIDEPEYRWALREQGVGAP